MLLQSTTERYQCKSHRAESTVALGAVVFYTGADDAHTTPGRATDSLYRDIPSRPTVLLCCATRSRRGDACTCVEVRRAPRISAARRARDLQLDASDLGTNSAPADANPTTSTHVTLRTSRCTCYSTFPHFTACCASRTDAARRFATSKTDNSSSRTILTDDDQRISDQAA